MNNKEEVLKLLNKLAPSERVILVKVIELIYEDLNKEKPKEGFIDKVLNNSKK